MDTNSFGKYDLRHAQNAGVKIKADFGVFDSIHLQQKQSFRNSKSSNQ